MWPGGSDEVLWVLQAVAGLAGASLVAWLNRPGPALWSAAVTTGLGRLGLAPGAVRPDLAKGTVEGVELWFEARWGTFGRELVLRIPEPLPAGIELDAEPLSSFVDGALGDPKFDRVVRVTRGDPARTLAILDPETRSRVAAAATHGACLGPHGWTRTWRVTETEPSAAEIVRTAHAVARAHLAVSEASVRKPLVGVIARLRSDRSSGVRRHALRVLIDAGQATPERLAPSLRDLDPELRLAVAIRLGARDVIVDLAHTGSAIWRVRAAAWLAMDPAGLSTDEREALQPVLAGALDTPELAGNAADALGRIGDPRVLPALAAVMSGPAREAARAATAQIRARYADREGALALVGETGALSVVGETGALSEERARD